MIVRIATSSSSILVRDRDAIHQSYTHAPEIGPPALLGIGSLVWWTIATGLVLAIGGSACPGRPQNLAVRSAATPEKERAIDPIQLLGSFLQRGPDPLQDQRELVLGDSDQQQATGVRSLPLGPLAEERRKIADIERDQNPALLSGQLQNVRIGKTVEVAVLVQSQHIVTVPAQPLRDHAAGDVRVKQQARGPYSPRAGASMKGYSDASSSRPRRFGAIASSTSSLNSR